MGYCVPDNVTWKSLDAGVVLLDLRSSNYYTLNETASFIWRAVLEGKLKDAIVADLVETYDCDPLQCTRDVEEQFGFLLAEGLLVEEAGTAG